MKDLVLRAANAEKTYTTNAGRFVTLSSWRLFFDPHEPKKNALRATPDAGFLYFPDQATRSRSTLSRGNSISACASPCSTVTQRGEPAISS
jgi:hypothetical protein